MPWPLVGLDEAQRSWKRSQADVDQHATKKEGRQ
jgi:hypothetical protein